jgi:hypothetical protein
MLFAQNDTILSNFVEEEFDILCPVVGVAVAVAFIVFGLDIHLYIKKNKMFAAIMLMMNGLYDIGMAAVAAMDEETELLGAFMCIQGSVRLLAGLEYPLAPLKLLAIGTYAVETLYYRRITALPLVCMMVLVYF